MDEYRKTVKRRCAIAYAFNIFVVIIAVFSLVIRITDKITNPIPTLFMGCISLGMIAAMITKGYYTNALNNDDVLREMYLEEHDERNILIRARSGETTLTVLIRVLIVAAFVSALFSKTIFLTLAAVLIFTWILRLAVKSHFKKVL